MAALKTVVNDASVEAFIASLPDDKKRQESLVLLDLYSKITGENPKMWGSSMIGFGQYHYKSERSSQEGDWLMTGFSPRKANITLYVIHGSANYAELLKELGKHTTGVGCVYIKSLADVDMKVLEKLVRVSYEDMKKAYPNG